MFFITLQQFIDMFHPIPENLNTLTKFMRNSQVKTAKRIVPFTEYIRDKNVFSNDMKVLFENFMNRDEYLTRFYNFSLKIKSGSPLLIHDNAKPMSIENINNNHLVTYKNVIRNMFYKEILQQTKSGFANTPSFLDVLLDFYLHGIIDYKMITPSALFYMKQGRFSGVFSSFYFRASIMNPLVPYSINTYLQGEKVFSPTLGWGSYAYGFLECPWVEEYVGVDVIPSVCKKVADFAKEYYGSKQTTIFCEPSENLMKLDGFSDKYHEYFDVVFFSPPYYRLELYEGENQSTTVHKTYLDWLDNYWGKTIELCYWVLKKGGKLCYILSDYGTKKQFDLLHDMNHITKLKFSCTPEIFPLKNKNANMTSHRLTGENIMIFYKSIH